MGNITITDTDFSFELDFTEDTDPVTAASCPVQAMVRALTPSGEDFFFTFALRRDMPMSQAMIIG